MIEVFEDGISLANEGGVGFVRIGNKNERVLPFKVREQLLRKKEVRQEHRRPGFLEFLDAVQVGESDLLQVAGLAVLQASFSAGVDADGVSFFFSPMRP